jgi:hypothetical protein
VAGVWHGIRAGAQLIPISRPCAQDHESVGGDQGDGCRGNLRRRAGSIRWRGYRTNVSPDRHRHSSSSLVAKNEEAGRGEILPYANQSHGIFARLVGGANGSDPGLGKRGNGIEKGSHLKRDRSLACVHLREECTSGWLSNNRIIPNNPMLMNVPGVHSWEPPADTRDLIAAWEVKSTLRAGIRTSASVICPACLLHAIVILA